MATRTGLTYQDYAALPDDGKRYEIHDGELWEMPAASLLHQRVLFNLAKTLDAYVTARTLGVVMIAALDVILSDRREETTILQPDIVYIEEGRRAALLRMRGVEGTPTLAIEILSPSTARIDRTTKRALYARYGVPYLWLFDLDAQVIEAHVLRNREYSVVATASGHEPTDLPPFSGLDLVVSSLWPPFPIQP